MRVETFTFPESDDEHELAQDAQGYDSGMDDMSDVETTWVQASA